jgi:hypothetical protein
MNRCGRYLRISWTVFCGLLCLLFVVLWVRSYYVQDCLRGYPPNSWKYNVTEIASQRGRIGGYFCEGHGARHTMVISMPIDDDNEWYNWLNAEFGFDISENKPLVAPRGIAFVFPHWLAALFWGAPATLPWIRYRFTFALFSSL